MRSLESEPFHIFAVGIDHINVALSIGRRTERQMPAIGRP